MADTATGKLDSSLGCRTALREGLHKTENQQNLSLGDQRPQGRMGLSDASVCSLFELECSVLKEK